MRCGELACRLGCTDKARTVYLVQSVKNTRATAANKGSLHGHGNAVCLEAINVFIMPRD